MLTMLPGPCELPLSFSATFLEGPELIDSDTWPFLRRGVGISEFRADSLPGSARARQTSWAKGS